MALNKAQAARQTAAIFEGITGQSLPEVSRDTRSMLKFLFPGQSDRYPIATKLAAQKLGVSQGTVQRWIRGAQNPRATITQEITKRVRQSVTTKRGRTQLAKRMKAQLPAKTRTIRIQGLQGPTTDPTNNDYLRDGFSNFDMSPEEQQKLYDAWANGGDTAATEYLTGLYDTRYLDGWQFHGIKGVEWR